jgi:hypothetical protein
MIDNVTHRVASSGAEERELAERLADAFDAPPPPRSLFNRIDRAVELEWGVSPQRARSPSPWRLRLLRRHRWIGAAGAVAAATLFAFVMSINPSGYAWADVLAAIARQGVVQVEDSQGVRWLSLSEGMAGEHTAATSRLLDLRQRVILIRGPGANEVQRRKLDAAVPTDDLTFLLVSFLRGAAPQPSELNRLEGLRLIDEQWVRRSTSGREEIVLQVKFAATQEQPFTLQLTLDPESKLPLACAPLGRGNDAGRMIFSYSQVPAVELRRRHFPADLAYVDFDESSETGSEVKHTQAMAETPPGSVTKEAANEVTSSKVISAAALSSAMLGAPSQWAPVQVVDFPDAQMVERVDSLLIQLWRKNEVTPVAPADEDELLRRVYLDLAGRTPTVGEVRQYLNDQSSNRYELLVDRLLKSRDHASHVAAVWRTFLIPEGVDLTAFGGVEAFDRWLAERIHDNERYDEIVRTLLLAEGRLSQSGPLLFYSAVKLDPDQLASRTARVFLGMRLECAQCHDHPFEPWSQRDFWSFAAFFAQISRPQAELQTVSSVMRVRDVDHGEVMLPDTQTVVAPQFLGGAPTPEHDGDIARRQRLAQWLTSPENPYFARATANRVWGHMFGKGLVDPVDDFGQQHPPKSPELLELLAGQFIANGFDLRELFRIMALSRAYRLASGAPTVDERRTEWFAQMNVKMLTAEQVYDCITVATMLESPVPGDQGNLQMARFSNASRDAFLQQFRTLAGRSTEYQGGIPQALTLMNGSLIEGATGLSTSGILKSLEAPFFTNQQRIEVLYFATLSRPPRAAEWELLENYIPANANSDEVKESLSDLLWALLNSAEFTMNH